MITKTNLAIITCSTRPTRVGHSIAQWFAALAEQRESLAVDAIDLQELDLPLFNEPEHPRLKKYRHPHTIRWSERVSKADAFVFVTPEYNFGPPPALVNAISYLSSEWAYKAAGFVSYGGISAGLRAVQTEKLILTALKIVPIVEAVAIPAIAQHLNEDKKFVPNDGHRTAAETLLNELVKWDGALRQLRA